MLADLPASAGRERGANRASVCLKKLLEHAVRSTPKVPRTGTAQSSWRNHCEFTAPYLASVVSGISRRGRYGMKTRYLLCVSFAWILGAYALINALVIMFMTDPDHDWPPTGFLFLSLRFLLHVALPGGVAAFAWSKQRALRSEMSIDIHRELDTFRLI